MAKIYAVSDVHGYFAEMKKALDEVGFDPQNPQHLLVSCGDAMDRGKQPREVIEFFNRLPNKVLVCGNHEILMQDAIRRKCFLMHDFHNGTANTAYDFCTKENAGLMSHAQILGELRDDPEYQKDFPTSPCPIYFAEHISNLCHQESSYVQKYTALFQSNLPTSSYTFDTLGHLSALQESEHDS